MEKKWIATVSVFIMIFASFPIIVSSEEHVTEERESIYEKYPVMTDIPPLTEEDFSMPEYDPDPQPLSSPDELPSQFSWTNYGGDWTTPARDQDGCGSCWDFSALGAMEAAINIASGSPDTDIDLSEQYVLSCLSYAGSCNGGWMHLALQCIASTEPGPRGNGVNGCTIESCMPYQARDDIPCEDKCEDWDYVELSKDGKLWQIESWGWSTFDEDDPSDWETIKSWIYNIGPLAVDIYASSSFINFWSTHHSPNDVYQQDDPGVTNHGVVVVGWVDDPDILNGGYWICKNSWGTSWGYNGFFNIAYGCNSFATRNCCWVKTYKWPRPVGPGPAPRRMQVFADFEFSPKYPHTGEPIKFVDTSEGKVVLTEWDFDGDGIYDATGKQVTHVFTKEGVYNVTVRVWSSWGLNSTRTRKIEVKVMWPPVAIIDPEYYSGRDTIVFFEGRDSFDVDGKIVRYEWDFDGDGIIDAEVPAMGWEYPKVDAEYNVTLTVTDDQGLKDTARAKVRIDISKPPETTAIVGGIGTIKEEWFKGRVRVTLWAKDWTGVGEIHYRVDDGPNETVYCYGAREYQHDIILSEEGIHRVTFYSIDSYGNVEPIKSKEVEIDATPPTIDVEVSGNRVGEWYTSSVTVRLSGSDELSGLKKIIYKVDQSAWKDYTTPISIDTDGSHLVWAFAIDNAGNMQGIDGPLRINIDTAPPTTTYKLEGEGRENLYYKSVTVHLIGRDAGSGVKATYYQVDVGPFTEYTAPFQITGVGTHIVSYYSVDNLGNREDVKSFKITISPVNFELEITRPTTGVYIMGKKVLTLAQGIIVIGPITIEASVESFTGKEPDVAYVEFLVGDKVKYKDSTAPYQCEVSTRIIGPADIKVTAYDSEGNSVSQTERAIFLII